MSFRYIRALFDYYSIRVIGFITAITISATLLMMMVGGNFNVSLFESLLGSRIVHGFYNIMTYVIILFSILNFIKSLIHLHKYFSKKDRRGSFLIYISSSILNIMATVMGVLLLFSIDNLYGMDMMKPMSMLSGVMMFGWYFTIMIKERYDEY